MEGITNGADLTKMPEGQKTKFYQDNVVGNAGAYENRNTGKMAKGTDVMRSSQMGKSDGRDSVKS